MAGFKGACAALIALAVAGAAQAQISDGKVKIGVLTDMSGPFSHDSGPGSAEAARMAIEEFGGKVAGAPIELVTGDHQNKADVGSALAREWFDQGQVDVAVDLPNSSVALAIQEIGRSKGRVLLFSGAGTADLTGKACSPTSVQWTYDSYEIAKGVSEATPILGKRWFFITADYAFGTAMEGTTRQFLDKAGATVVGAVRAPLNATDYSSFLVQAQGTKPDVVALMMGAGDIVNATKQAKEFGIQDSGAKIVGVVDINDVHAIGLPAAQGLVFVLPYYPDRDAESKAFVEKFLASQKRDPSFVHVGVYSSVRSYLKAVEAAKTDDAKTVIAKMQEMPVNDAFAKGGVVRRDGRMVHDVYLMQTKTPAESKGEWDLVKYLSTIPGDKAFRPLAEGGCPYL
jgi:branched-chain amino acid transport system substrate-binding protein